MFLSLETYRHGTQTEDSATALHTAPNSVLTHFTYKAASTAAGTSSIYKMDDDDTHITKKNEQED